jgi:hypothetical protein
LGAKSASGIGENDLTISTWLFERNTSTVGRIKLEESVADSAEINAMIAKYDEMTNFVWPVEWKTLVCT